MIEKSVINDCFTVSYDNGFSFCEIFFEDTKRLAIGMINGKVEEATSGISYGVGIRIFNGLNAVYAYTNDVSRDNLIKVTKELAQASKGKDIINRPIAFNDYIVNNNHNVIIPPSRVLKSQKVKILKEADMAAMSYSPLITQTRCGYGDTTQQVLIANTEGVFVTDTRIRTRIRIEAVASSETEKQSGFASPGAMMGFELFDKINHVDLAKEAAESAITMLKAGFVKGGKMPVIINNGFGGVLFHEACGHSLEATSVAKGQSVFSDKLGERIASPLVTAIDDGTIKNAWGSLNVDDEGNTTQKNILIENGILKGYLIDKLNGLRMGKENTGSGRRESYKFAPTSRMTNTYIDNGDSNFDDIIKDTAYGLYCKNMGGGSVDPATGVFNFAVMEGYIVRNGEICEPVRGAALIGKGEDVLSKIDMVGNNLEHAQGMCGSISGNVPTNVGQPTLRVSEMTVGGRS